RRAVRRPPDRRADPRAAAPYRRPHPRGGERDGDHRPDVRGHLAVHGDHGAGPRPAAGGHEGRASRAGTRHRGHGRVHGRGTRARPGRYPGNHPLSAHGIDSAAVRFVYLGPEGTFAEQALTRVSEAERAARVPARSVPEALDAVRSGEADAALVPVETSVGGQIGVTLDELATGQPLIIVREVVLPVEFVLAARTPVALDTVRTIAAHPQASAQCRGWLRENVPNAAVVDVLSNGAAAVG